MDPMTELFGGDPGPDERQWAMFAHLSALAGALVSSWFGGFGVFVGPLVIWLLKKDTMPFVDDQGKEALNFNITMAVILFGLFLMTIFTLGIGIIVTGPLFALVGLVWLAFTIVAAIRANEGRRYRYPLTVRLIK
jgi:uncharacterized Tic20 family protein